MSYSTKTRPIFQEPRWLPTPLAGLQTAAVGRGNDLPRWLLDGGSLTARLQALGEFRVHRLSQHWQQPLPSERSLLSQAPRQLAMVREVLLLLDEQPVVFARSVFPLASLSGELTHLRRLHNSSLGAILFRHPDMRRSPFEVARLQGDCDYLPGQFHQPTPAWGRRSHFRVLGKSLMVSEVFLQPFRPWGHPPLLQRSQRGRISAALLTGPGRGLSHAP